MSEDPRPDYISLRDAAKYSGCYSQDYLKLRARQGKLKAVKIARNWLTTKEWIDEYLERVKGKRIGASDRGEDKKIEDQLEKEKYISLKQATKFCSYSQDYLSLRARQGKLKAVKFGRNWVTKKEWVDEYLRLVKEYKTRITDKKRVAIQKAQKKIPEPTPVFKPVPTFSEPVSPRAIAVVVALVFIFTSVGFLLAYPYFEPAAEKVRGFIKDSAIEVTIDIKEFASDIGTDIGEGIVEVGDNISENISDFTTNISAGTSLIAEEFYNNLARTQRFVRNSSKVLLGVVKEFGGDLKFGASLFTKEVDEGLIQPVKNFAFNITNQLSQYISQDIRAIKKGFQILAQKIKQVPQKIVTLFKKPEIKEEILSQEEIEKLIAEKFVTEEQLFQLQQTIDKLKEEGLPQKEIIKEVQKITQIQPERIITKETLTIDDKSLAQLKSQIEEIQQWEKDIQTLQTLTSKLQTHPPYTQVTTAPVYIGSQGIQISGAATLASLGVSGSAGITNLGVGGSTSLGSDSSDKLTVNATANFLSSATFESSLIIGTGTTTLTLDSSGNITSGAWQGTVIATQYGGTGQDWSSVATGSIPYFSDTGTLSTLSPTTSGYFLKTQGAGQPPTWAEVIQVWSDSGTALYPTNLLRKVGIGTTTPTGIFEVATSTGASVFIVDQSGYVGIGASTPQAPLHIESITGPQLRIGYDTTNYFELNVTAGGSIQFRPSIDTAQAFQFQTAGGGATVLDIDTSSQLVGLGTTTPARKLDVSGSARIWDQSTQGYTILELRAGENQLTNPLLSWQDSSGNTLGVISNQGYLGFGTTTPTTPLYIVGTSTLVGNLDVTGQISIGNTTLSDGTLDLGTGSDDDLTTSDITDLTDSGATTLHKHGGNKTDFFAPEYESGVLQADGSNNTGTMISDSEIVSNVVYNYYKWTSSEASKQDYDIVIHLRVPDTFSSWQTNAITFYYKTGLTGTTNNAVSWAIYEDGNATPLMSSGEMASSVADTWTSDSATSTGLSALTAGNVYRIVVKLAANSTASAAAYAGKISINYLWYSN